MTDKDGRNDEKENASGKETRDKEEKGSEKRGLRTSSEDGKSKLGDEDKDIENKMKAIDAEMQESEDVQLIFTKKPDKEEEFSIWSVDYYLHRQYKSTSPFLRYLIHYVVFSALFIAVPITGIFVNGDSLNLGAIFDPEATGYFLMLRKNLFLCSWFNTDLELYLIMENSVLFCAAFLRFMRLYESSLCWSVIENFYTQRIYARLSLSCFFGFYLSNKFFSRYTLPAIARDDVENILKTILLWAAVYSGMVFFTKFIIGLCTFEIRRSGYKKTLFVINHKSFVFKKMKMIAETASQGEDIQTICEELEAKYDDGLHLKYADSMFSSKEMAAATANNIYAMLGIKELDSKLIAKYFPKDLSDTYRYFSGIELKENSEKKVKVKDFIALAEELYLNRRDIDKTLHDQDSVFNKLDSIFTIMVSYLAIIILMFLFGADYRFFMASFGTSLLTFSWIFSDSIKILFNCFIFLLVVRPYNVGDKVVVEDVTYYVYKVDLLTTTFITPFNEIVYIPNVKLNSINIHNIARSPPQCETLELIVGENTTYEMALEVEKEAVELIKKEKMFFSDCHFRKIAEGKMYYEIVHTKNFQNAADLKLKRNRAIEIFKKALSKAE